jgi:hypothetical protein
MNNWKWRDDEIQLAQFLKLTSTKKQEHIQFLLTLSKDILSTNDEYILYWYGPKQKSNNFYSMDEVDL